VNAGTSTSGSAGTSAPGGSPSPASTNAAQGLNFGRFQNAVTASATAAREGIDNTPTPAQWQAAHVVYLTVIKPLDEITDGRVVTTSWFRSPALNSRIGGEAGSQHVRGEAVDWKIEGMDRNDAWALLQREIAAGRVIVDQAILYHRSTTGPNIHTSSKATGNRRKFTFRAPGGAYVNWTGQTA
jgi:hypothetical protein